MDKDIEFLISLISDPNAKCDCGLSFTITFESLMELYKQIHKMGYTSGYNVGKREGYDEGYLFHTSLMSGK